MLFPNQFSSSNGNISCPSFSIRRSSKVQPHSVDHTCKGLKETEEKGSAVNNMACEKINNGSNSDQGMRCTMVSSSMDKKKSPLQPETQASAMKRSPVVVPATLSVMLSAITELSDLQLGEQGHISEAEPSESAAEPSETSCDDLTESSFDVWDVPDLVDEDCVVESSPRSSPLHFKSCSPTLSWSASMGMGYQSSTSSDSSRPLSPALKSAIKSSLKPSKQLPNAGRPSTARRVRGLWNNSVNDDCHWYKLRDETVTHILGFLNLAETLKVGMVANRYLSLVRTSKSLWVSVDATEFVQTAHTRFLIESPSVSSAQERTGKALEDVLRRYKPISLIIRDIHNYLSADSYLPNVASLHELTLTHFDDLTDTHAHVLLLMTQSGTKKKPNSLRKLSLNYCPRLTNASLRSVASLCASLESLSLYGCMGITRLDPLATLLVTETKKLSLGNDTIPQPASTQITALMKMFSPTPTSCATQSSRLSSMFAPPSNEITNSQSTVRSDQCVSPSLARDTSEPLSPPRSLSPTPASSLQSLFAPPGMSPPRKSAPPIHSLTKSAKALGFPSLNGSKGAGFAGKLQEIDLRGTGVNPSAIVNFFSIASNENSLNVSLRRLLLDGNQWTDRHLDQIGGILVWNELSELSLACAENLPPKSGSLSDDSLTRLAGRARFSKLIQLNLSGQQKITGHGVANVLQQTPKLQTLICRRNVNLITSTSLTPLMKRLIILRKKQSLRLIDLRDCELEPMLAERIKSNLSKQFSTPVQLFL